MAATFQFKLVTPTGIVYEGLIEQAIAVGALGEFGVLAGHTDFITSLVPGVLTLRVGDGSTDEYLLTGGLAEVKDGILTILALEAIPVAAVDPVAAAPEVEAAEARLAGLSFDDPRYGETEEALKVAQARAQIAQLRRVQR
jgi:F-type H+-transporting ATPase subunit epsilon